MDTSHCLRRHGFILLLVLFHSYVFSLASNVDVSYDARGIKIHRDQKRFLSNSNHHPRYELGETHQHVKKHMACLGPEASLFHLTGLACLDGYVITKINFADYGNPTGTCDAFKHGNCGAPATLRLVKKNCLGRNKCELINADEMFGPSHCKNISSLAVRATCTAKR